MSTESKWKYMQARTAVIEVYNRFGRYPIPDKKLRQWAIDLFLANKSLAEIKQEICKINLHFNKLEKWQKKRSSAS